MAKDKEALFNEKPGRRRNMEKFCLALIILAALGLIIGLIAYLASNSPRNTSDYVMVEPNYPSSSSYAINNGEKWIKDYQITSMGMMNNENADAFLALRLGLMSKYKPGGCDFNLLSRGVEYDLLSTLMRNRNLDGIPWVRSMLAKYIIALEAACVDPTRFYGNDLLGLLDTNFRNFTTYYKANPNDFATLLLAKCISGVELTAEQNTVIMQNISSFRSVEDASLALLALSCINSSTHYSTIMKAETYLMSHFVNDSFRDTYQTGLAIQALTRSNTTEAADAIEKAQLFLAKEIQIKRMGRFLTVGEASNVLPALAGMSWADVKGKCPTKRIVPTDPNAGNIQVNIEVGESGQIFNGSATIKKGKTLLDVLQTLQKNSTFTFMSVKTAYGYILTSVMGQTMDLKSGQNWNVILKGIPLNPQSMYLDRIIPEDAHSYTLRLQV